MPWNIIRLKIAGSTMTEAACRPPGTVVVAEQQTAGQGRLGRSWYSEAGAGLYLSAVLEFAGPAEQLPVVTLALGLAVQEAIHRATGVACDLRWPNDVLAGGKKCAGILVELHGVRVIAGIGVNVNHTRFPGELAALATSLRLAAGRRFPREQLLAAVLASIDNYQRLLVSEGPEPILRLFSQASSYVHGRQVKVETAGGILTGITDGLDPAGFLWLRTPHGRHLIRAGGVRPR